MSAALGAYLRALRIQRRATLRAVEAGSGVSNSYLSQLERGRIARPSPPMLGKLARWYGVPVDRVLATAGYTDPQTPPAEADLTPAEADEVATFIAYLVWKRTVAQPPGGWVDVELPWP